jgi:hypothetical protein
MKMAYVPQVLCQFHLSMQLRPPQQNIPFHP